MNDNEICKLFERENFTELTDDHLEQAIEYCKKNEWHLNDYFDKSFRLCYYYLKEEQNKRKEQRRYGATTNVSR